MERLIVAGFDDTGAAERDRVLAILLPLQRTDFVDILSEMDGLPVTIRLLDPPLHEFLPDRTELTERVPVARLEAGRAATRETDGAVDTR